MMPPPCMLLWAGAVSPLTGAVGANGGNAPGGGNGGCWCDPFMAVVVGGIYCANGNPAVPIAGAGTGSESTSKGGLMGDEGSSSMSISISISVSDAASADASGIGEGAAVLLAQGCRPGRVVAPASAFALVAPSAVIPDAGPDAAVCPVVKVEVGESAALLIPIWPSLSGWIWPRNGPAAALALVPIPIPTSDGRRGAPFLPCCPLEPLRAPPFLSPAPSDSP